MYWLRFIVLTVLLLPHLVGVARADVAPKWTSIIKNTNRVFGFQLPVNLLRSADGTLHTVVWSRTLPSATTYKTAYVYRSISASGILGGSTVIGETTEQLNYLPGLVEQADGSIRIYFYSTDSDPRTIKRASSNVARTSWSIENVPSLTPVNFRSGIVAYRGTSGDILHTLIEDSSNARRFVVINPGQEPVTAFTKATATGSPFWIGSISQSGGVTNTSYFLTVDPDNKNKASIGFLQTNPSVGSVTENLQGKNSLGNGYEGTISPFGTLLSVAPRIGASGDLLVYPVASGGKTIYSKFNLWRSDTGTTVVGGSSKQQIRGVALAPTPGGGAFLAFYTDANIFIRQTNNDLSKLGRIAKVEGPKLSKKSGAGYLSQLQANASTGALDLFSAITNNFNIDYSYARLLPIIEFKVTPKTIKRKGATALTFTLSNIEGTPLVGAEVALGGTKTKVLTDSVGQAIISTAALKKKSSSVQFKISASGYQTETISLDVK